MYVVVMKLNITESFKNSSKSSENKKDVHEDKCNSDNMYINNFMKSIQKKNKKSKTKKSKKNSKNDYIFRQEQFNNNYRDTLTAFNNIAPDQKTVFNIMNLPVDTSNLPNNDPTVVTLVKKFVGQLNQNVKTQVGDRINKNSGWDEKMPEPNMKSGWDEAQTKLGLPTSLFDGPAPKASVKIDEIKGVQRESTEAETRYRINVILKKRNTRDKIAVRLNFVTSNDDEEYGKRYINDGVVDRNTNVKINKSDNLIIIEEIAILGFFIYDPESCQQINGSADKYPDNDLFDFGDLVNNDITDQTFIMKELTDTYKRRIKEANGFNAALDTEGRNFSSTLLNTYNV